MPAATPALIERVDPNCAIEQVIDGNFGVMVAQQGDRIVPVPLADVCRLKTVDMDLFTMAKIFF